MLGEGEFKRMSASRKAVREGLSEEEYLRRQEREEYELDDGKFNFTVSLRTKGSLRNMTIKRIFANTEREAILKAGKYITVGGGESELDMEKSRAKIVEEKKILAEEIFPLKN